LRSDDFERRLSRLFDQAPAFPDEALFAARVNERLNQGQSVRRLVIGAVGGLGAVVATGQILSTGVLGRMAQARTESAEAVEIGWSALTRDSGGLLAAVPMQGEMLWTVAGLGALAVALLAARLADPL
jgi:hypothetical protein